MKLSHRIRFSQKWDYLHELIAQIRGFHQGSNNHAVRIHGTWFLIKTDTDELKHKIERSLVVRWVRNYEAGMIDGLLAGVEKAVSRVDLQKVAQSAVKEWMFQSKQ